MDARSYDYDITYGYNDTYIMDYQYDEQMMLARQCLENARQDYISLDDGKLYCNSSWDEYSCWPRTLAGTFAIIPCPGYLPGIDDSDNATKYCNENGTWASKANYNLCLDEDTEEINEEDINARAVRFIYNIGFSLSTLTLVVALFIFLYFRSLRCLRNSIHCHLIVSFIFMNVMWIIMRHSLIPIQDSPHLWLIKVEVALFNYSQGTNFFWMFVEGLYLHIIIVWTYSADKIKLRYLFVIGWVLPAVFIVAWIIVMQTQQGESSWLPESMGENGAAYEYIYIAPILFVLFANIIFLSTIVWVLITKLRASHSLETRQYRKAVKATVILFPLLGITYVLFIVPPSDHPQVHIVFNYINAVLQSLQGFFVAVFYCFLNGEVKGVLKKRLLRYNDARSLSSKYTKTSMAWTRASRDYTTTVSFGNGAILNQNRRNNGQPQSPAEEIPLKSREGYDTEECVES